MIGSLCSRWRADGGYREFLVIAFPLILSTASWSVQHFVDRVFLAWYSTETLAAALPGGMSNFVVVSLFQGTAAYVNTFVAQYIGAGRPERVGPALWQGVYLALVSGAVGLGAAALADPLFAWMGHEPAVRGHEAVYFRVLCYGIGPLILSTSLSCFYSGRGRTGTVLTVNAAATLFNIVADYALIFGHWGLPEMGIRGAAWATNGSAVVSALLYAALLARPTYRRTFATYSGWRLDRDLFARLLRYGGPSGLNFMVDIAAFSLFVLIVGRVGTLELTATNLAFNINSLAFMPLIGAGMALSTMVGQRLGRGDPDGADFCTWTGLHLALAYMGLMAAAYALLPQLFLLPYGAGSSGADFDAARDLAIDLLRIVAAYCLFDAIYMTFTATLKGAGDTRYIMLMSMLLAWVVMVLPCLVAATWFDAGVYTLWAFIFSWVAVSAIVFYLRFRTGKWRSMRVIEEPPALAVENVRRLEEATGL